jgi:hypothetical protein
MGKSESAESQISYCAAAWWSFSSIAAPGFNSHVMLMDVELSATTRSRDTLEGIGRPLSSETVVHDFPVLTFPLSHVLHSDSPSVSENSPKSSSQGWHFAVDADLA